MSPTTRGGDEADPQGRLLPPATFERIRIRGDASDDGVPLSQWLEERRRATTPDPTLDEGALRPKPPTAQRGRLSREDVEERLRIAISIARALANIHGGNATSIKDGYRRLSLDNILLDLSSDGRNCDVTLNLSGWRSKEEDMKQLGCILNAVFDGHDDTSIGKQHSPKVEQDRPFKKRETNHQTMDHMPLYLSSIISALLTHNGGVNPSNPSGAQYLNFKDVLQDLRTLAENPEVYLGKNGRGDANHKQQLRVPRGSFYGRKSELSLLLHSLDTVIRFGQPVLVSVSGHAGVGKTCLLNQVKGPIKNAGGFIIRGKFNTRMSSNLVVFSALNAFFGEINAGSVGMQAQMRRRISKYVGCGLGVLTQVIPNLRTLMMEEDECCETDIEFDMLDTAHQQWKLLICKLVNAIYDDSRPLVIYFDDLHWCDENTLDLIQALVMDQDICCCLFLVSYRSNDHANKLSVARFLGSIQTHGVRLVSLKLSSIEKDSINLLVSEMLCKPPSLCKPLSTVVHNKTGGLLVLYAIDFLKSLQEEGKIKFNFKNCRWEYNLNEIRQRKVPVDVVQHLSERMKKMPNNVQSLLKTASVLGFEVNRDLLQMTTKRSMELLPYAIESGFLQEIPFPNSDPRIVWSHDEIRTAAYELIPLSKRMPYHMLIGARIYMNASSTEVLNQHIFDVVNNMNVALELITSKEQRTEVSQLNLTAGKKAMASSSFSTASEYFKVGIGLLVENCWECNYEQAMILHQAASEALFAAGEFDSLKYLVDEQLNHAKCLDDKLHAYYIHLSLLRSSSNVKDATETAFEVLGELGQTFSSPSEVTPDLIYKELASTKAKLKSFTKDDVLKAPRLTDEKILWTTRFMDSLIYSLYYTRPKMMPLVACRMISLSLEYGYCPHSAMGFLTYGHACYSVMQDIDEAYRCGKISVMLSREGFSAQSLLPKLTYHFHTLMSFWKEPLQATCDELLKSHQDLLMVGDIHSSMGALTCHPRQGFFAGKELATVEKEFSSVAAKMASHSQTHLLLFHSSHHLLALKLVGGERTMNPFDALGGAFNGEINDEDALLEHAKSTGKMGLVHAIFFNRLFGAYWFKRYTEAAEMSALYKRSTLMPLIDAYHAFYSGLTAFRLARYELNESKWMEIGEANLSSYKIWATHSLWNWENKYFLLQAESHFCKGEIEKAEGKYKDAIESARKHRFVHEEGLANELLSTFYASTGESEKAGCHFTEAKACYERWGAFALLALLDSDEQ